MAALSTSILVGSLIGAGTQLGGAYMGSRAAKKAGETQAQAANEAADRTERASREAMDYLERQRLDSQAAYAPYITTGSNAFAAASRGMGLPAAAPPAAPMPGPQGPVATRSGVMGEPSLDGTGPIQPARNLLDRTRNRAIANLPVQAPRRDEPMVYMRDPVRGKVKAVPQSKVEIFKARGATVVPSPDAAMAG